MHDMSIISFFLPEYPSAPLYPQSWLCHSNLVHFRLCFLREPLHSSFDLCHTHVGLLHLSTVYLIAPNVIFRIIFVTIFVTNPQSVSTSNLSTRKLKIALTAPFRSIFTILIVKFVLFILFLHLCLLSALMVFLWLVYVCLHTLATSLCNSSIWFLQNFNHTSSHPSLYHSSL